MNYKKSKYFKLWIKNSWPYLVGAILLSLLQIVTLVTTKNPWGISRTLVDWGAWLYESIGGDVKNWFFFNNESAQLRLNNGFFNDPGSMRNLGIILGALLASLLASQFKIKKIKSKKQAFSGMLGGLLMGYGARLSFGCTIGAMYTDISSLSLSGWVFALFLFLGAIIGSKILLKFFI